MGVETFCACFHLVKRERGGNGYARGHCGCLTWARVGVETFRARLHLAVH